VVKGVYLLVKFDDRDRGTSESAYSPPMRYAQKSCAREGPRSQKCQKVAAATFWNATPRKRQNCQNCSGAAQAQIVTGSAAQWIGSEAS